jgi:hypothetical protein
MTAALGTRMLTDLLSRDRFRLRDLRILAAAVSMSVAALGGASCSSASSDDARVDAGRSSSDGGITDARPPSESGLADAPHQTADGSGPNLAADGSVPVTMNDVSILFPLPTTKADVDNLLAATATGDRGPLLPDPLYLSTGMIQGSTTPIDDAGFSLAAYGDLRVVAARLDPCFASTDPDPHGVGCMAQLRLIFQQVTWTVNGADANAEAFDSALHAFYSLTRSELYALARALVDLRVANTHGDVLGPLAPHPIMVRQGLGGTMSKGVQKLIVQYAGGQNLVRLAQLSSNIGGVSFPPGSWTLTAFDVPDGGTTATPRSIPALATSADGGPVTSQALVEGEFLAVGPPEGGQNIFSVDFLPQPTGTDSFAILDNDRPDSLSPSMSQAALDNLVRVENPADDTVNTIDCGSCHVVTQTEQYIGMPVFSFDDTTSPFAFSPDGTFVTSADMAVPPPTNGLLNIHAFSYFNQTPGINRRVANETAAVVEYLNQYPE